MPTNDWLDPGVNDLYSVWPLALRNRDEAAITMFNTGDTWDNLPENAIRWNDSAERFEKWTGTVWTNLSSQLTAVLKIANNLSDLADASVARANLSLGSLALLNSPLDLAHGGTGGTTAATARSNLQLGSLALQAANSVTITGGSITGMTSISILANQALSFVSNGAIAGVANISNAGQEIYIKTTGGSAYYVYFGVDNVIRCWVADAEFTPATDATFNLGNASKRFQRAYTTLLLTNQIQANSDLLIQINSTTYWVFSSADASFRPNVNASQNLGAASYVWANAYIGTIIGSQTSIHLSDSNDAHLRYVAGASGSHRFYNAAGSTELWRFESNGKAVPIAVGQKDYAVNYAWTQRRTLDGTETLAQLNAAVATIMADLVDLGFFQ